MVHVITVVLSRSRYSTYWLEMKTMWPNPTHSDSDLCPGSVSVLWCSVSRLVAVVCLTRPWEPRWRTLPVAPPLHTQSARPGRLLLAGHWQRGTQSEPSATSWNHLRWYITCVPCNTSHQFKQSMTERWKDGWTKVIPIWHFASQAPQKMTRSDQALSINAFW